LSPSCQQEWVIAAAKSHPCGVGITFVSACGGYRPGCHAARSSAGWHAKGLRRPNAPTSGRIVTQIQSVGSRPDSPVRIRYAQPGSPVSRRHVDSRLGALADLAGASMEHGPVVACPSVTHGSADSRDHAGRGSPDAAPAADHPVPIDLLWLAPSASRSLSMKHKRQLPGKPACPSGSSCRWPAVRVSNHHSATSSSKASRSAVPLSARELGQGNRIWRLFGRNAYHWNRNRLCRAIFESNRLVGRTFRIQNFHMRFPCCLGGEARRPSIQNVSGRRQGLADGFTTN
jgi:hypothetical protein